MNGTRVLGGQRGICWEADSRAHARPKPRMAALFASSAILSKLLDLSGLQLFIYKMEIRDAHFLGLL